MKYLLLDLFCGAGGAAQGYYNTGLFDVMGVDIAPQPRYPFDFLQADVLGFLHSYGLDMYRPDAIHASPPCQHHSAMTHCRPGLIENYPPLIEPTRELLEEYGAPYVMENVPGAPLRNPVTLCGFMFGRELYRHRLFETNWALQQPTHQPHTLPASRAGHWEPGTVMSISGHIAPIAKAREVMEMNWTTREELAEAVPPYYTEHVGYQLARVCQDRVIANYLKKTA